MREAAVGCMAMHKWVRDGVGGRRGENATQLDEEQPLPTVAYYDRNSLPQTETGKCWMLKSGPAAEILLG